MTRDQLLGRCKTEGVRMQEASFALDAIAGVLRADAITKAEKADLDAGLNHGQLDGLLLAIEMISDRIFCAGDNLEMLEVKEGAAA